MKILLTNDDGIYAPGIKALYKELHKKHDLNVVAPDIEKSAVGHGLTILSPLRIKKINLVDNLIGYAVSGNPADCVKLAIKELNIKPDIAVSGINRGSNMSIDINYSGTVAAAKEAALFGIPAIAVSIVMGRNMDYEGCAEFIEKYISKFLEIKIPFGTLLNINIPSGPFTNNKGIKITRQEVVHSNDSFDKRKDTFNRDYYWYSRRSETQIIHNDTDIAALKENYISVTPVKCDMTDYSLLEMLKAKIS